jgi:pyruvate formate lyase activating enzyme
MTTGIVFDIKKYSIHDGPGIRTTVFLKGCGLRCWWCHNPESQQRRPQLMLHPARCIACGACMVDCPQGAIQQGTDGYVTDRNRCVSCGECVAACYADARELVGREMTVQQVMQEVRRDTAFFDESAGGVTFSGGEPLLQADFLLDLLKTCKAEDLHTVVDTCGYASTVDLDRVRGDVDLFLYDLKVMDSERHRQVTGVDNRRILENLVHLAQHGHRIVVRMPIIPGINDDDANIRQTAQFISGLPSVERVDLLAYHKIGSDKHERLGRIDPMPETQPPSEARMMAIKATIGAFGLEVRVGGA